MWMHGLTLQDGQNHVIRRKRSLEETSFDRVCSFPAMYDASYKVCRNVRWKDSTVSFEESRIETILRTQEDLRNNEYKQLVFSCFSIVERGKPRDIRACHINDRLVQNSLCEQALLPNLTPKFIYDNCATLKNKGIDFALARVKKHMQDAHRTYGFGRDFYGARIDIRKYFDSIDHKALKKAVDKNVSDPEARKLCHYLIDTFSFKLTKDKEPIPDKQYYVAKEHEYARADRLGQHFRPGRKYYECAPLSLGLGSQTSQLFALLMLNEIDHYIKEQLHIKFYGRYMDDLYLFHNDSKYLAECLNKIETKLELIGLHMNRKKTTIQRISPIQQNQKTKGCTPFKYLKWNLYLTTTNRVIMLPFKEKIYKQRRKLRKLAQRLAEGLTSVEEVQHSYAGWRAHMQKGNTFYIVQDMDNYFHSLFKGVEIL